MLIYKYGEDIDLKLHELLQIIEGFDYEKAIKLIDTYDGFEINI